MEKLAINVPDLLSNQSDTADGTQAKERKKLRHK
jgi:hypothetical protein